MAGFQVSINGRFWVSTEAYATSPPHTMNWHVNHHSPRVALPALELACFLIGWPNR